MKKIIIIMLTVIMVITCFACNSNNNEKRIKTEEDARNYFKDKFNFELPKEAKMIEYSSENVNNFQMKVFIKSEDVENVILGFSSFFETEAVEDTGDYNYAGPVYSQQTIQKLKKQNTCFDFEYDNIERSYHNIVNGEGKNIVRMRVDNWIFLCKDNDTNYYLYVSHM